MPWSDAAHSFGPQCPIKSGIQTLRLRKNGFVSLSNEAAGDGAAGSGGTLTTTPFHLPTCSSGTPLTLRLNIFTSIGRGAFVELKSVGTINGHFAGKHVRSTQILGGGVDMAVDWLELSNGTDAKTENVWVNGGCAYEAKIRNHTLPPGACDHGNYHKNCSTSKDCLCYVMPGSSSVHCNKIPGTCEGVHAECLHGICQAPNVSGGQACGRWEEITVEPPPRNVGVDLSKVFNGEDAREVSMSISMWAGELYSIQFTCG
eukprot:SAG31_NODE_755_length_12319_cov_6.335542_7_plen_259_part_00